MSDMNIHRPQIRAPLGTALHFCEVVAPESSELAGSAGGVDIAADGNLLAASGREAGAVGLNPKPRKSNPQMLNLKLKI